MANFVEMGGLRVDPELYSLVRDEIAPGTGIQPEAFWRALSEIVTDLAPKNRWLLEKRNALQKRIDEWCLVRRGQAIKLDEYKEFLFKIGYLVPEGGKFKVTTANVDPEITRIAATL
jgi:malate synthase